MKDLHLIQAAAEIVKFPGNLKTQLAVYRYGAFVVLKNFKQVA